MDELIKIKKELQEKAHSFGFNNKEFSMSFSQMKKRQATLKIESFCQETPQKALDSVERMICNAYMMLTNRDFEYKEDIKLYPNGYVYTRVYRINL